MLRLDEEIDNFPCCDFFAIFLIEMREIRAQGFEINLFLVEQNPQIYYFDFTGPREIPR